MSPRRVRNAAAENGTTQPHTHEQTLAWRQLTTGLSILLDPPRQTVVLMPSPSLRKHLIPANKG